MVWSRVQTREVQRHTRFPIMLTTTLLNRGKQVEISTKNGGLEARQGIHRHRKARGRALLVTAKLRQLEQFPH